MSEKIDQLTPEQEAQLAIWPEKWEKIGLSCEPADRQRAEAAIPAVYKAGGLEPPDEIVWCDSPQAAVELIARWVEKGKTGKLPRKSDPTIRRQVVDQAAWGQFEAGWFAWQSFFTEVVPVEGVDEANPLREITESAGLWWPYDNLVVFSDRPEVIYRDDWGRLHAPDRKAVQWRDGTGLYAVQGVVVPDWIIEHPERITPAKCDAEENLEIRRVMIDRLGGDKYMASRKNAKMVHSDEYGQLWQVPDYYPETGESLCMVKVVNSTANPDGSYKDYWIQVPPDQTTARGAVAWTFSQTEAEYDPMAQS